MKKILKLIVLLFISNYGYSQIYYSHYLDATSEWRVIEHHGEAAYHDITFRTIFFEGLENINGYTYYKMYQTYYKIGYDTGYTTMVDPQSTNTTLFMGYFREDPNNKFYLFNNGTMPIIFNNQLFNNGVETVYFDNQIVLNAQIGDLYFNNFNTSLCSVDILSTMNINAINYKLILSSLGGKSLEGVGKILDACSSPQSLDTALATFIRIHCYTKQGVTYSFYDNYYLPAAVNCNTFPNANRQGLSTVAYEKNNIKLYPNPTTNILNIETATQENINSVKIYTTLGQEALSINNPSSKINIEKLKSGTYFIKVKIGTEEINSKFIKE